MHLRQDFWSIRGQITYLAWGPRLRFKVSRQNVKVIPVAMGTRRHAAVLGEPMFDYWDQMEAVDFHDFPFEALRTTFSQQWRGHIIINIHSFQQRRLTNSMSS